MWISYRFVDSRIVGIVPETVQPSGRGLIILGPGVFRIDHLPTVLRESKESYPFAWKPFHAQLQAADPTFSMTPLKPGMQVCKLLKAGGYNYNG